MCDACFKIGNKRHDGEHEVTADLTIDVYPAEPSVGIMYSTAEIVDCEVIEFNEFQRHERYQQERHDGDDSNWEWADELVLARLIADKTLHDAALENVAEDQEWSP